MGFWDGNLSDYRARVGSTRDLLAGVNVAEWPNGYYDVPTDFAGVLGRLALAYNATRGAYDASAAEAVSLLYVLDEELIGPLGTVVGIQKLKEHGVTNIFPLEANLFRREPAQEAGCCIYIARPRLKSTQIFANHMRENDDKLFSLFFVPRRSITCEQVLEAEGLLDRLAQPVSEITKVMPNQST